MTDSVSFPSYHHVLGLSRIMPESTVEEKPFVLSIPDEDLSLLRKKLDLFRFPDELDNAGWDYGTPLADVKRLTEHWKSGFDWRKVEAKINELPMFTRDIEVEGFGKLNIHYIHKKSEVPNAIPLLFVHGCECHDLFAAVDLIEARATTNEASITRARTFPRGGEDAPVADVELSGPPKLPRRRA